MDVIVIGIFKEEEKIKLDQAASLIKNLKIEWDYENYNIEAYEGIKLMESHYGLYKTGILIEPNETFTSYPLIHEISENVIKKGERPKLLRFIDSLANSELNNMIIAFADEWSRKTLVRIENHTLATVEARLNSVFVWCEEYINLESNSEIRGDDHPLLIELEI